MRKQPPEEAIAIIGSLLIMTGIFSAANILFYGWLDLNVFAILFGYKLFKGSSNARVVVLVFSGIALAAAFVLGVLFALRDLAGWNIEGLHGPETIPATLLMLGALAAAAYTFYSLKRKDIRTLFESGQAPIPNPRPLTLAVSLVSAFLVSILVLTSKQASEQMDQLTHDLFPYHVRISAVDKQTGKPLPSFAMSGPTAVVDRPWQFPKFQNSTTGSDGIALVRSGLSDRPLSFKISALNYVTETITIDRYTDDEIRVELTPVPADQRVNVEDAEATASVN